MKGSFQNLPLFSTERAPWCVLSEQPNANRPVIEQLNTKLNTQDKVGYLLGFERRTQDITAALLIKTLISSIQRSML